MNEWIWDGKMDYGWEDLAVFLKKSCCNYTSTMIDTVSCSPNEESKALLSTECMERFKCLTFLLSDYIADGIYYHCEDLTNDSQNAIKLNSWIILGSLTESALQMFLAFYMEDYKNTKWQQWDEFKVGSVQTPIIGFIQQLVDDGLLDIAHGRSLKDAIKDTIREHTKEHKIQRIMLDELIQLFKALELFEEDEITYLKEIQSNRNGIHSFESRTIGTWSDLQQCIRFFCYLMEWELNHLPDIPDTEYC